MTIKKVAAVIAVAGALTMTGCAATAAGKVGDGQLVSRYVDTPEGGEVLCVFWVPVDNTGIATAEGAQMDCNWEGIK